MKKTIVVLTLLLLTLASCNFPATTGNAVPAQGVQAAVEGQYPSSPEAVVQAYLTAYSLAPEQMSAYISSAYSADDATQLVKFNGMLEGFVIDSASVSPEMGAALVNASARVGGENLGRQFELTNEDGRWVITAVKQTEPATR